MPLYERQKARLACHSVSSSWLSSPNIDFGVKVKSWTVNVPCFHGLTWQETLWTEWSSDLDLSFFPPVSSDKTLLVVSQSENSNCWDDPSSWFDKKRLTGSTCMAYCVHQERKQSPDAAFWNVIRIYESENLQSLFFGIFPCHISHSFTTKHHVFGFNFSQIIIMDQTTSRDNKELQVLRFSVWLKIFNSFQFPNPHWEKCNLKKKSFLLNFIIFLKLVFLFVFSL